MVLRGIVIALPASCHEKVRVTNARQTKNTDGAYGSRARLDHRVDVRNVKNASRAVAICERDWIIAPWRSMTVS